MALPPPSIGGGIGGLLPPARFGGTGTPSGARGGAGGIPRGGGGMPGGAGGIPIGGGGIEPGGGKGGALKGLYFCSSIPIVDPLTISKCDSSF
jgi:hypothetical protein